MAESEEYRRAKRHLLSNFSQILSMSEDMWPEGIPSEGYRYDAWRRAHDDLQREFDRRAVGDGFAAPIPSVKKRAKRMRTSFDPGGI